MSFGRKGTVKTKSIRRLWIRSKNYFISSNS